MVYDVFDVAVRGIFALYELDLSLASVSEVLVYSAFFVDSVSSGSNEVWLAVFRYVMCW